MLEINQLKVFHGVIEAVHGIDVSVSEGQCVSLLGPNGAGKTSTLSAITGTAKSTGSIRLLGEDMTRLSIEERCRKGIAISPEGRRIFSNLTVRDNMLMGGAMRRDRAALLSEIGEWFERFP
ncbi:MAG: ATP-binding cassette domain-containing protein, partial [Hoeflea sp.]|nr:ATP-binding cassette domain-containing protein [Hoeflea sp.]